MRSKLYQTFFAFFSFTAVFLNISTASANAYLSCRPEWPQNKGTVLVEIPGISSQSECNEFHSAVFDGLTIPEWVKDMCIIEMKNLGLEHPDHTAPNTTTYVGRNGVEQGAGQGTQHIDSSTGSFVPPGCYIVCQSNLYLDSSTSYLQYINYILD
jgi:hypothetical protein